MSTERIHLQDEKIKGGGYIMVTPLIMNTAGPQGPQGATGLQGVTGVNVPAPGVTGADGLQGETGVKGTTGVQGTTGPRGNTGVQGGTGVAGDLGGTGIQGATGAKGATGVGATGPQGETGIQGLRGIQGVTGYVSGLTGPQGMTGVGSAGSQGATGVKGATGIAGVGMNILPAGQIPASNGVTGYQYGGLSYDAATQTISTSVVGLFPGQTVSAGQFIQQASTYVTNSTWDNGWRDTVAWSPTYKMEYLEWAHFTGMGNWEDFVLRLRSDKMVQINDTILLTDSTTVAYIGIASADQALVDQAVINDTVIRAASTGGGSTHHRILMTCDHGNSTGLSVVSPTNSNHYVGIGKADPQWTLDTKGSTYRVGISGDSGPSQPDSSGVVLYFDGSDLMAKRLDGKTSKLSVTWA